MSAMAERQLQRSTVREQGGIEAGREVVGAVWKHLYRMDEEPCGWDRYQPAPYARSRMDAQHVLAELLARLGPLFLSGQAYPMPRV